MGSASSLESEAPSNSDINADKENHPESNYNEQVFQEQQFTSGTCDTREQVGNAKVQEEIVNLNPSMPGVSNNKPLTIENNSIYPDEPAIGVKFQHQLSNQPSNSPSETPPQLRRNPRLISPVRRTSFYEDNQVTTPEQITARRSFLGANAIEESSFGSLNENFPSFDSVLQGSSVSQHANQRSVVPGASDQSIIIETDIEFYEEHQDVIGKMEPELTSDELHDILCRAKFEFPRSK